MSASGTKVQHAAAPPGLQPAHRLIVTVCTIMATLMQSLDSTIANVALPYMQGTMSASQEEINWVLTSYIVAAAIMTAPTGFLAARFGRTRLFVTAVAGFTIASVLCGMAQSLDEIVIFRVLQGMCGAALVPLSQSVMFDIYPPEQRGRAMALWTMGVMIGPIFGPDPGRLADRQLQLALGVLHQRPVRRGDRAGIADLPEGNIIRHIGRLDWIGFGALSLAIGAFQTMLDRGETLDWFARVKSSLEACLAGIGFYLFLVQFSLAPKPFLSPRLFTDRNFVVGIAAVLHHGSDHVCDAGAAGAVSADIDGLSRGDRRHGAGTARCGSDARRADLRPADRQGQRASAGRHRLRHRRLCAVPDDVVDPGRLRMDA